MLEIKPYTFKFSNFQIVFFFDHFAWEGRRCLKKVRFGLFWSQSGSVPASTDVPFPIRLWSPLSHGSDFLLRLPSLIFLRELNSCTRVLLGIQILNESVQYRELPGHLGHLRKINVTFNSSVMIFLKSARLSLTGWRVDSRSRGFSRHLPSEGRCTLLRSSLETKLISRSCTRRSLDPRIQTTL